MNDLNDTIITVSEFSRRHTAFSEGSLRWLIFQSKENGLAETGAIIRIGRRVLIDENLFFEWARNNQELKTSTSQQVIA